MSDKHTRVVLQNCIAAHLDKIAKLFNQPVKMTIVIRTPELNDGGVLLSDDTLDEAITEIRRLSAKEPA